MGTKSQLFGLGGPFLSKDLTSMAPAGELIIDPKRVLKTFSFFYSYDWRSEKLIIDLKKFISKQRYSVMGHIQNISNHFIS